MEELVVKPFTRLVLFGNVRAELAYDGIKLYGEEEEEIWYRDGEFENSLYVGTGPVKSFRATATTAHVDGPVRIPLSSDALRIEMIDLSDNARAHICDPMLLHSTLFRCDAECNSSVTLEARRQDSLMVPKRFEFGLRNRGSVEFKTDVCIQTLACDMSDAAAFRGRQLVVERYMDIVARDTASVEGIWCGDMDTCVRIVAQPMATVTVWDAISASDSTATVYVGRRDACAGPTKKRKRIQ